MVEQGVVLIRAVFQLHLTEGKRSRIVDVRLGYPCILPKLILPCMELLHLSF